VPVEFIIIIIIIIYSHTGNTGKKKNVKKNINVHSVNWIIKSKTLTIILEK